MSKPEPCRKKIYHRYNQAVKRLLSMKTTRNEIRVHKCNKHGSVVKYHLTSNATIKRGGNR